MRSTSSRGSNRGGSSRKPGGKGGSTGSKGSRGSKRGLFGSKRKPAAPSAPKPGKIADFKVDPKRASVNSSILSFAANPRASLRSVQTADKSAPLLPGMAKQGPLTIKAMTGWKRRWAVLTDTDLELYAAQGDSKTKEKYSKKKITKAEPVPQKQSKMQYSFSVVVGGKQVLLAAPTGGEVDSWIMALKP